ncbi:MAG: hypothetical protein ACYC8T_16705, partial [Myxococcaceae bacterium]
MTIKPTSLGGPARAAAPAATAQLKRVEASSGLAAAKSADRFDPGSAGAGLAARCTPSRMGPNDGGALLPSAPGPVPREAWMDPFLVIGNLTQR